MTISIRNGLGVLAVVAAVTVGSVATASAQNALVVDGEEIASAELWDAAKKEGTLLYYTVNFEDNERAALDQFKEETGIDYSIVRLSGARMYERVVTESSGGQLNADLISLTDFVMMDDLNQRGILAPYKVAAWEEISDNLKHPDGLWITENQFAKVIGYNTEAWTAEEAPKAWKDMLDPKFKGQIGIQEAGSGGISWSTALFQRKVVDDEFWTKLAANEPRLYNGLTPLSEDVARGEVTVGEMTPGLVRNQLQAGAPIGMFFPEEGVPAVGIIVALTTVGEHPNAGKLYLNWLTSAHGGSVISRIFGDWASNPKAAPPDLSEYGIDLPSSDRLWLASREDWINLKDTWLPEWDKALRN
jgi:iron(III) transport system substrate-binding protein